MPDWVPSTVKEQTLAAGVVLEGMVTQQSNNQNDWSSIVTLSNANYYKSCGPSEVKVQGFRSSAACGIDPPGIGTKLIVFACKDEESNSFILNEINIHTGAIFYTEENDKEVKKSLKAQQTLPGGQCGIEFYYKCQNKQQQVKQDNNQCIEELFSFIL